MLLPCGLGRVETDAYFTAGDGAMASCGAWVFDDVAQDVTGLGVLAGGTKREVKAAPVSTGAEGPGCAVVGEEKIGHLSDDIGRMNRAEMADDELPAEHGFADAMTKSDKEIVGARRVLDAG